MFSRLSRKQTVSPARRQRRPSLEMLEGRQLMSLGAEFIGPVNTTTRGPEFDSDNATSSNGSSVVVWTDTFSPTDHDIRAQRFNASGGAVGTEIVVSFSSLDESHPRVAIDGQGRFEVAWTQQLGGDSNVVAQRFDANGVATGSLIQVANTPNKESDPDIAADPAGNFVVSYTNDFANTFQGIIYKEYNSGGTQFATGSVVNVNVSQSHSSVAISASGLVDLAYEQTFSPTDHDIYLAHFGATGLFSGQDVISFSSSNDQSPSVAVDDFGNGVVAWERAGDIKARRFTAVAGTLGAELRIASTPNLEQHASVALKQNGPLRGGFAVAYESVTTNIRTIVAEVSASDNRITPFDAGVRSAPAVSVNASGDYLLTSTSNDAGDLNIRGRRGHLFF